MGLDTPFQFFQRGVKYGIRRSTEELTKPIVRNSMNQLWVTREELLERAKINGSDIRFLGEPEQVQFDRPIGQFPPSEVIEEATGTFDFESPFIVEIENATIRGPLALSSLSSGELIAEKDADRPDLFARSIGYYIAERIVDQRVPDIQSFERVVPLVGPMAKTYFHWFADYLSRIEFIEAYAAETGAYPTLLIPSNPPTWISESLSLIDYPSESVEEWEGGVAVADRLIIPSSRRRHCPWSCSGFEHFQPSTFRWLREELGGNLSGSNPDHPSIVFVSREDAKSRRVVNRTELLKSLSDFRVEKVVLSERSLRDQINLFQNIDLVISPHGAGLVNTAFGKDLGVVELYGSHYNALFYSLAEGQANPYASVRCKDVGDDIRVDTDRVRTAVKMILDNLY